MSRPLMDLHLGIHGLLYAHKTFDFSFHHNIMSVERMNYDHNDV